MCRMSSILSVLACNYRGPVPYGRRAVMTVALMRDTREWLCDQCLHGPKDVAAILASRCHRASTTRGRTVQRQQQHQAAVVATFFSSLRGYRMMIIICYCSLWTRKRGGSLSISFSELIKIRLRAAWNLFLAVRSFFPYLLFSSQSRRIITSCSLIIQTRNE